MRATTALISKTAALSLMLAYGPALAQDVAPETPPELRDFRLDPQPARPSAQPSVEPVVTPPPTVSTVPEANTPMPRNQAPTTSSERRSTPEEVTTPPLAETAPDDAVSAPPAVIADPAPSPAPEISQQSLEPAPAPAEQYWWQIAAALGLISMTLIAVHRFRRSRNNVMQFDDGFVAPAARAELPKAAPPVSIPPRPAPPISKPKPRIAIDFIPDKATISFTALTIKGELRLINESDLAAKNMQLRAGLITASERQDTVIAAFHQATTEMPARNLADVGPGERIGMAIELTVPLTELQSFPLGDQQLFVPIMVGNIAYSDDAGTSSEVALIACMIGREASPPKPKMAPLRLDLGPRSFSPLGQRPVLT